MKQYTPNLFCNKYFNVSDIIEPDFHSLYHSRGLYTPLPVNGSLVLLVNNYTLLSSWWHLSLWLALAHEIWVIKLYAIVMFYVKLEQKISLELHSSTHPPLSLHHNTHVLFRLNLGMETIWHNLELNWIKAHFWSSITGRWEGGCRCAQLTIISQMSRQVSRGSAGEYQADEQAGVLGFNWRLS